MLAAISVGAMTAIAIVIVIVFGALFLAFAAMRSPQTKRGDVDISAVKRDEARERIDAARHVAAAAEMQEVAEVPDSAVTAGPAKAAVDLPSLEAEVEAYAPPVDDADPIEVGITRRQVLNRSVLAGSLVGLAAFGGASIAFLVPPPTKGFGGKVAVTTPLDEIIGTIETSKTPFYVAEAKTYLQAYVPDDEKVAEETYPELWDGIQASGLMPLYQKCPHLGCRVPWCDSSQWFECPCHGSQYNKAGEQQAGPAPRGMDRFEFEVSGQNITINTGAVILGPTIGVDTVNQPPQGDHCV